MGTRWPAATLDGTIRLWDVADPAHPRPLSQPLTSGGIAAVDSVAFSPDGHTLASGNLDGTIRLWDVADPAHPRPLGQPLTGGGGSADVDSLAFSPDGHTLACANADGTVRLLDVADPAHPLPLGQRQPRRHHPAVEPPSNRPDRHRHRRRGLGGVQP